MSILIKGMDMPECCEVCPCYNWVEDICRITESPNDFSDTRIWDCPLVEVPTPHGRLIDCERKTFPTEFRYNTTDYAKGWNACMKSVHTAPTIIEAEENRGG
jgi:hypothetical protein